MIESYSADETDHNSNTTTIKLSVLTHLYNLTKLFPYPTIQNISYSLNPKILSKQRYNDLTNDCLGFDTILLQMYKNMPQLIQFYKDYASGDELVSILIELYEAIDKIGFNRTKPSVYVNRHDFMYDRSIDEFIEVEYNLTAASAGFHAENTRNLLHHYYTIEKDEEIDLVENNYKIFHLNTFLKFWSYYHNPEAYIAIILNESEWNIFETIQNQRLLLDAGIKTVRILVQDIHTNNFWLDENNNLIFQGKEIGMVYYRYLYDATHFINDSKDFVIKAELSNAICLPSVETWMINTKMNQYLMYSRSVQERYGIKGLNIKPFKKHLCPHYMLKDSFGNDKTRMIEFVKRDIDNFLLKTFKEGGFGDIIAGENIIEFITSQPTEILNRYLLVKKIKNAFYPTIAFIEGKVQTFEETVSEIGVFTSAIFKLNELTIWNLDWQLGSAYLIRTKPRATLKGGIAVNASFVDVLAYK